MPQYFTPNLYRVPDNGLTYINLVGGPTTSGVQNKNGGVIAFARPGATQSRFHLETDGNLIGKVSDRVGGYPVLVTGSASGSMGITRAVSTLAFGKVTAQQYIVYSLKANQQVGGSVSTVLQSPGARFNGVDKAVQNRNPGYFYTPHVIMMNGGASNLLGWNYITGRLLVDNPSGTQDTLSSDLTAQPTRALPGQLIYLDAGKTIISGFYKPKTS